MSMRMLLGYDPKETKKRPQSAGAIQLQSHTVMASNRPKYNVPMSRVKRLPPIREEGQTPRQDSVRSRPSPRDIFVSSQNQTFVKPLPSQPSRPISHVRPILREPVRYSPSPDIYKRPEKPYNETYDLMNPLSPLDVNHTIVDGLVADYLHFARYGQLIPVYEGTGSTTCPCCTDRNRQNVRTLLGFQNVPEEKPRARKYDKKSYLPKPEEELKSSEEMFPNSLYAKLHHKREPSVAEKQMQYESNRSQQKSWMSYQPLPYATNYLNPEFNRASEINSYYESQVPASHGYISGNVVDADSRFDTAMNRLQNLSFGSGGYVD